MSIWAHVAAVIRYDDLRIPGMPTMGHPQKFLGRSYKPYEYGNLSKREHCDMPCGSEGSLEWNINENPDRSCLAAYVVTVHGDLRDYEDWDEIEAYLNRITEGKMVRQGTATVEVEGREIRYYSLGNMGCKLVATVPTDFQEPPLDD